LLARESKGPGNPIYNQKGASLQKRAELVRAPTGENEATSEAAKQNGNEKADKKARLHAQTQKKRPSVA